ncbi:DUF6404 family protein [Dyella sp. 20L07]|uniref:DUF6404 family protein n=1 Tax=Dyella sp. 20L07 TaxID=3384240 RepID=UPI003D26AD7F
MDALEKRRKALQMLAATGIHQANYAPPATRLMWRLGINVPPPHFARFTSTALGFGVYFALAWGLLMKFGFDLFDHLSLLGCVMAAGAAGLFFGVFMAGYYAWGRRKHGLPTWDALDPSP